MSVRGRAFSLKIGGGGFFSNYQCRCSKKQSTVAINSPHNVKENWNFVFHSKNLLFCSYSRRNLTEKITLDFFFWFFFSHLSITTYLPIFLDNLPKSILLPEKKNHPPFGIALHKIEYDGQIFAKKKSVEIFLFSIIIPPC